MIRHIYIILWWRYININVIKSKKIYSFIVSNFVCLFLYIIKNIKIFVFTNALLYKCLFSCIKPFIFCFISFSFLIKGRVLIFHIVLIYNINTIWNNIYIKNKYTFACVKMCRCECTFETYIVKLCVVWMFLLAWPMGSFGSRQQLG